MIAASFHRRPKTSYRVRQPSLMPYRSLRIASWLLQHSQRHNGIIKSPVHVRHNSTLRPEDVPLRILFCGADRFSAASLEALFAYSNSPATNVASIDVACKTDKRGGRGMKEIIQPPIKPVAEQLGLPIHQFDTFRGWNMPVGPSGETYINMVVAVSFGLLVPPRILRSCQFGGLNVHPSILPDLKGSTPIEHAIIYGYRTTGITVQTLHPTKFDEGHVVLQNDPPGIIIPNPDTITANELHALLAPKAADMLVQCLRDRLYLRPVAPPQTDTQNQKLHFAPKLSKNSSHVDFKSMNATHVMRLNRALGKLWVKLRDENVKTDQRLIFGPDIKIADACDVGLIPSEVLQNIEIGLPFILTQKTKSPAESLSPLMIRAAEGSIIAVPTVSVSGMAMGKAAAVLSKAKLLSPALSIDETWELRALSHMPM